MKIGVWKESLCLLNTILVYIVFIVSWSLNSTTEDSSQNTKANSDDGVEITGIFKSNKTVEHRKLDKTDQSSRCTDIAMDEDCTQIDVDQSANLLHTPRKEKPIWEGTEDEQMKWALAESAKSAEKESRAKINEQEQNKAETECPSKSTASAETASCDIEEEDFNLASDLSDDDLVNAAQESEPDECVGLKGGGPITHTTQHHSEDLDFDSIFDNTTNKNCSVDSDVEKSPCKKPVLKNGPIKTKRHLVRRHRSPGNVNFDTTPTLGKFDGNLLEDSIKENKVSTNGVSHDNSPKSSWFSGSFREEDMAKAINLSLHEQVRLKVVFSLLGFLEFWQGVRGEGSYMKQTSKLVRNFELNP